MRLHKVSDVLAVRLTFCVSPNEECPTLRARNAARLAIYRTAEEIRAVCSTSMMQITQIGNDMRGKEERSDNYDTCRGDFVGARDSGGRKNRSVNPLREDRNGR